MEKRESSKDNIVLFPGLERRLLEKGMEMLREKDYRKAIEFLEQALIHESENSEAYVGLVLSYFESGNAEMAKSLAEEMLKKGVGDYIQVVDLYIMILVQLSEYDKVVSTIEVLLEEKEVPNDKFEHFSRLLHFSRKMVDEQPENDSEEMHVKELEGKRLSLFSYKDPQEQMMIAARLANENIRPYIEEIKNYLKSEEGHPFQKSMLINILREQDVNNEVEVKKFGLNEAFIPSSLPSLQEMEKMQEVAALVERKLESEDPVLCENIKSMVERNFFLIYPFNPQPESANAWAAAYHYLVSSYLGNDRSLDFYAQEYKTASLEIEKAVQFIKRLEEISYPII